MPSKTTALLPKIVAAPALDTWQSPARRNLAFFAFLFTAGVTVCKSTANALFMAKVGATSAPFIYLSSAALVTVFAAVLSQPLRRSGPEKVLAWLCVGAGGGLFFLIALSFRWHQAYTGLAAFAEAYATLLNVVFWAVLGQQLDPRQARQTFTFVAAVSMMGAVTGGVAMRAVPAVVPAPRALSLSALSLFWLPRLLPAEALRRPHEEAEPAGPAEKRLSQSIFTFVFLVALLSATVDYAFRLRAGASLSEVGLHRLYGDLNAVVGLGAVLFQLVLAPVLMRRLGLFGHLSIAPFVIVALCVLALAYDQRMAPWFALKSFEMAASFALIPAAAQLLYQPLPAALRAASRARVDAAAKRIGAATGGLLLLGLASHERGAKTAPIFVSVALLLYLPFLRRRYLGALTSSLAGEQTSTAVNVSDATTRAALLQALRSDNGRTVVAALDALGDFPLDSALSDLMMHADTEVRSRAIKLAFESPDSRYTPALVHLLADADASIRRSAAAALGKTDPEVARTQLTAALSDESDPALRAGAIAAMWHSRTYREAAQQSLQQLRGRLRALDIPLRIEYVRLIGSLGRSPYSASLGDMLEDPSPSVRRATLRAIAETEDATLLPLVLRSLGHRETAAIARETLAAYGDAAVPRIWSTLDDLRAPLSLRLKLPRVLRAIGTPFALEACLYSNPQDDPALQHRLVSEIARLVSARPDLNPDRRRTDDAILRRLALYATSAKAHAQLANAPPHGYYRLLRRACRERVVQTASDLCRLLALHRAPALMNAAEEGLASESAERRAHALELLDEALKNDPLHGAVMRTLEQQVSTQGDYRAAARQLMVSRDALLTQLARGAVEEESLSAGVPLFSTISFHILQNTEGVTSEAAMSRSSVERILFLEGVHLFSGASLDDVAAFAELCSERVCEPHSQIFAAGDAGEQLYIVRTGSVQLSKNGQVLLDVPAGESFGHVSVVDRGDRPVDAFVGGDGATLLCVERHAFMELVSDRPELLHGIFRVLTRRLRDLIERQDHDGGVASV